jgi:hypothetical protein
MLPDVARMILRQFGYANTQDLREVVQKQIDLEQSGAVKLESDQSVTIVPESFRAPYQEVFPMIKKEVSQGLKDQKRSGEALIEIFTTFLRHRGSTCESFSDEQKRYLTELTQHTVAEMNVSNKNRSSGFMSSFTSMEALELKGDRLTWEILRAVEQELQIGRV